jgi:Uma2 family endonuclease
MSSTERSPADAELPAIDDRLVEPETRYEIYDGELTYVSPADRPHGIRQSRLCALLEVHTGEAFEVGNEVLTRTSKIDDIAPDVSVFPEAPHPETGGRQLEQLAFEIVSTESLGHATRKAAKLSGRGVRRVFAIDIKRSRVLEWSAESGKWTQLDGAERIEDPALEAPLQVGDMLDAAKADGAIARALISRHNPVIEAMRTSDRAEGVQEGIVRGESRGLSQAILTVLAQRGIAVGEAERARILDEQDCDLLERWVARAAICSEIGEVFAER